MMETQSQTPETAGQNEIVREILAGYRFRVCETPEDTARALDVRRRVYVEGVGYDVPVPDAMDHRSWLLLAEHEATGEVVGTMRITPHFAGSFELEEYFTLPASLRGVKSVEINRFAILPAHRKGKTFLPVVSLGLFKLAITFLRSMGAHHMVIASKPDKIWTYEWLGFHRTGRFALYGALDAIEHELLSLDVRRVAEEHAASDHPFAGFFTGAECREVSLPERLPTLGIGVEPDATPLRQVA